MFLFVYFWVNSEKVTTHKADKNIKEETEGSQPSSDAVSTKSSQSSPKPKQDIKEELLKEPAAVRVDSKDTRK